MHFFGSDVVAPGTGSLLPINERGLFLENQSKLWKNTNIFWRSKVRVFLFVYIGGHYVRTIKREKT